jgi:hypothetical protein
VDVSFGDKKNLLLKMNLTMNQQHQANRFLEKTSVSQKIPIFMSVLTRICDLLN